MSQLTNQKMNIIKVIASAIGWRAAFELCWIPGLLFIGMLFFREPVPGEMDGTQIIVNSDGQIENSEEGQKEEEEKKKKEEEKKLVEKSPNEDINGDVYSVKPTTEQDDSGVVAFDQDATKKQEGEEQPELKETLIDEYSSPSIFNARWVVAVGGYIAVTFGMGGFSDWLPTMFIRVYDLSMSMSSLIVGGIIVVGGLLGTVCGGFLGDIVKNRITTRHPYMLFSAVTMLIGGVFSILTLFVCQDTLVVVCLFLALGIFFGWNYNGPLNAVLMNSVTADIRSLANGVCMLLIHLLGDAISPSIIGWVSDQCFSLRVALLLVPLSLFLSGLIWGLGWLTLPSSSFFPCFPSGSKVRYTIVPDAPPPDESSDAPSETSPLLGQQTQEVKEQPEQQKEEKQE